MAKKQFKAESKKVLDMMINSIYTNKDIFLRELVSNSSDALDKLYYLSLTNKDIKVKKEDLKIRIDLDKDKRTITITDNGLGMTKDELEHNLGTIAESGSLKFKEENDGKEDVNIIGQFGVGFYSAFMVSKKVEVLSKSYKEDTSYMWTSEGVDGYTITEYPKEEVGTKITLYLKDDTDDIEYSDYLTEYKIRSIIKKYSDYIAYPIIMEVENSRKKDDSDEYETYKELETINSRIPLWKKDKKKIEKEEYNNFYKDTFYDYDDPIKTIHYNIEGNVNYTALLYIPSHAPYNYYTKEYEKGLKLYTNGVLIMDKAEMLLPDYFSFVKGVIDTEDIPLNISRETLQDDKNIKLIAKSIESKIKKELLNMLKDKREDYIKFYKEFGMNLKFGIYNDYGINKDNIKDLIMFYSSKEKKLITLEEYTSKLSKEDKNIYYATGETTDKIDRLPQVELFKDKDKEVLYLTEYVDEFAVLTLNTYNDKIFVNVSKESTDLSTEEEKKKIEKENEDNKELLEEMKKILEGEVKEVKLTNKLKSHPACITTEGEISSGMEKVINAMPGENISASLVLEINNNHNITKKLKELYKDDKDMFAKCTKVLYLEGRLIEGLPIDNPTEMANLISDIIVSK